MTVLDNDLRAIKLLVIKVKGWPHATESQQALWSLLNFLCEELGIELVDKIRDGETVTLASSIVVD
jgi:hypothetical protein